MLSKRYESTEVDRRTWLHVPEKKAYPTRLKISGKKSFTSVIQVTYKWSQLQDASSSYLPVYGMKLKY